MRPCRLLLLAHMHEGIQSTLLLYRVKIVVEHLIGFFLAISHVISVPSQFKYFVWGQYVLEPMERQIRCHVTEGNGRRKVPHDMMLSLLVLFCLHSISVCRLSVILLVSQLTSAHLCHRGGMCWDSSVLFAFLSLSLAQLVMWCCSLLQTAWSSCSHAMVSQWSVGAWSG